MKIAKLLSLSLVASILFSCKDSPATSQVNDTVKAANTPQGKNYAPQETATNNQIYSPKKNATRVNSSPGKVTQINTPINSSSSNLAIDETSYDTVSKSLDTITLGCQKIKKTEQYIDYEICKKGDTIVNASEYAAEADAGSVYWFSPDGRVVAMRYFGSGATYTFDSNGKVSAKFNVYDSKKVNNISAEERNLVEETLSNGSYKEILKRF